MSKNKHKLKEDIEYDNKFGFIPNDIEGRIQFIMKSRADNMDARDKILKEGEKIKNIPMRRLEFDMWKVFKPSRRPRVNSRGGFIKMYVPGAAEDGRWFENFSKVNQLPKITTPCILNMIIYERTPVAFNMKQKILAEIGVLKPWRRTGDFDNYAKSVSDAIQHGLLEDDSLVYESTIIRRYSVKPHVHIELIYFSTFPEIR